MNPWSGLRSLPRDIWIIFFASLVNRAGTMVLPFLVLYFTDYLNFTAARAGFLMALYGAGALIAAPLAGWLSDRYGGLRIMRESLLITGAILFVFPFVKGLVAVSILVVAMAVINEMFRPANLAYISLLVTADNRKPAFSLIRLAINLGMSIGPAAGGFLADFSFRWLFFIDGGTSVVAGILLAAGGLKDIKADSSVHAVKTGISRGSLFQDKRFLGFILAMIPIAFVFFQHLSAMPLFMVKNLGLAATTYGLMFTLNTLVIVALEVPLNLATSHWSDRFTLFLGCLLFAVGFGGMALATGVWSIVVTVLIWTFGEMILFPGASAYVAHIASPEKLGKYMGIYTMCWGFAFTFAPWIGTYLLEHHGPIVLWGTMFVIGIISCGLVVIFVDKKTASSA